MKNKCITIFLLLLCLGCSKQASAQQNIAFSNGFHLGVNVEGNVAEKLSVHRLAGDLPEPKAYPTLGWKAGVEFSYHFCDYFGVSAGLDMGTTSQFAFREYCTEFDMPEILQGGYFPKKSRDHCHSLQIPIKLEFHYPIKQSRWSVYGRIGVNLIDVLQATYYLASGRRQEVADEMCWKIRFGYYDNSDCYQFFFDANGYKLKVDAQLNLGIYYQLPYRDLLRFGVVANFAFQDKFTGYYTYRLHQNEFGAMSYRHNYMGLEFSYSHCFKTREERIKKRLDKYAQEGN